METKTQKIKLTEDLSYIDNIDDLDAAIRRAKAAMRRDERFLKNNFKDIPAQSVKATFGNAVPFFAKTVAAENTWNVVKTIVSLLIHNPEKKNFKGLFDKNYLQQSLKQIGIYLGLNLVKSFLAKKQTKKKNS